MMNIQILGTKKCNDTKKAERFFKERGIRYQFIDMKEKGMSKGEFNSVAQVNGGLENMINWDGKDKDLLALIKYTADEDKMERMELMVKKIVKDPLFLAQKSVAAGPFQFPMINPVITKKNGEYQTEEGCLSLEGVRPCTSYAKRGDDYGNEKYYFETSY